MTNLEKKFKSLDLEDSNLVKKANLHKTCGTCSDDRKYSMQESIKQDLSLNGETSFNSSSENSFLNVSAPENKKLDTNLFEPQSLNLKSKSAKKKNRSIFPAQQKNYGPKATLKKVTEDYLVLVQDPLSQQLSWTKAPLYVLVIKKMCNTLFDSYIDVVKYLLYHHNLIVYVEERDFDNEIFKADEKIRSAMVPNSKNDKPSLRKFCKLAPNYLCKCALTHKADVNKIDLIICLGGDGTLLHVSNLFQESCPPVLSVHLPQSR